MWAEVDKVRRATPADAAPRLPDRPQQLIGDAFQMLTHAQFSLGEHGNRPGRQVQLQLMD